MLKAEIEKYLTHNMYVYRSLDHDEQAVVIDFTENFCKETEFLIAPDVDFGPEIAWCVAANAALVGAAQRTNYFSDVKWVYLCGDDDLEVDGDALGQSTVRLHARTCLEESKELVPYRNLVVHEFAHILDNMLEITGNHVELSRAFEIARGGLEDGAEQFIETWYEGARQNWSNSDLEFFAYSTEAFFTAPNALKSAFPELTEFLIKIYGINMPDRLES